DIADAGEGEVLVPDDDVAGEDAADQSSPKHEPRSAQQGTSVAHQDSVVDLAAKQPADDRGEDEIANRFRIVATAGELALGDDLRHDEREEYGESKACELERTHLVRERLVDHRGEDLVHAKEFRPRPVPG